MLKNSRRTLGCSFLRLYCSQYSARFSSANLGNHLAAPVLNIFPVLDRASLCTVAVGMERESDVTGSL
jgi:hypothetical protein